MARIGQVLGGLFVLLGLFWAGRETDSGLGALVEHRWCSIPLVLIVLGVASVLTADRLSPRS